MHYCGHQDKLYADLHLASIQLSGKHKCTGYLQNDGIEHQYDPTVLNHIACTDNSSETNTTSCCDPSTVNSCEEEAAAHDDCCVDLEQPVVTDDNYKSSQFNLKIQITSINLLENHSFFHVASFYMESQYLSPDQNIPDAPDLTRLGALLL